MNTFCLQIYIKIVTFTTKKGYISYMLSMLITFFVFITDRKKNRQFFEKLYINISILNILNIFSIISRNTSLFVDSHIV